VASVADTAENFTVDEVAQKSLETIRLAIEDERIEMTSHFDERIAERGLLWVDVLVVVDEPLRMEYQELEEHGWPKWKIAGTSADGVSVAIVVAIRPDNRVRFVTIFWEE